MEEWRDIKGYEGLYQVSNEGRIKSLERIANRSDGKVEILKEKIRKLTKDKDGYLCVPLVKELKRKFCKVHRLVAKAFIDNPDNLPEINHKDECKSNNSVENLEWCDRKYNTNYGTRPLKLYEKQIDRKRDNKGRYITRE